MNDIFLRSTTVIRPGTFRRDTRDVEETNNVWKSETLLKNPQLEAEPEGIESYRHERIVRGGFQVRETSRDIVCRNAAGNARRR